ncbi:MAG: hypothetical protein JW751_23810, partial [Polyangiaceae bacterium]|nr:hypothetical protein [Polyangiaceae bacterium]
MEEFGVCPERPEGVLAGASPATSALSRATTSTRAFSLDFAPTTDAMLESEADFEPCPRSARAE